MVESVKSTTVSVGDRRIAPVERTAPARPAATLTQQARTPAQAPAATTLAQDMAVSAPVDADRVRAIKAAVAAGTFPINPARIADTLIALRYDWMADDKA